MENVIIVSADGHASVPPEVWPQYLEKQYHELLPRLYEENEIDRIDQLVREDLARATATA
jgi:hypothetical protein